MDIPSAQWLSLADYPEEPTLDVFAAAVFLLIITPGPGVLSTAGVGSAYGYRAGLSYVGGLFIGTNLVALAVVTGLAAAILANPVLRTVLAVASVGYLIYLAFKIAFAGARVAFIHSERQPGLRDGLALQAINPKAYAVNTTFFSNFAFVGMSLTAETMWKFVIMNAIWVPIHLLWLWFGVAIRRLDLPSRVQFMINLFMAAAMLGVVALALWQQFVA
jgi:threonine/homoserine/homoserine lactone efflux protein